MVWESKSAGGKVKLRGDPVELMSGMFGLAIRLTDCNDFDLPR